MFTETRSSLQNSFTPTVVGSTVGMASPLPLQHANTVCYVSDFNSLPDHVVSDLIPQITPSIAPDILVLHNTEFFSVPGISVGIAYTMTF
jgi:hypothetical protein